MDDVPVSITLIWLKPTEAPVETTVAMLVPDDTAEDTEVIDERTVDMPTVAVDSEPEKITQMLFSVETLAWLEVTVVFDWAVDSRVPTDVTLDSRVDSDWVADSALLCWVEIEFATDSRVDVLTAWLTWLDWVVLSRVETLRSSDRLVETTLDTDVAEDRTAELDVPTDVPAEVIAEVETTLLMTAVALRNELVWVDAKVARLVRDDRPVDMLVSADLLLETAVCSDETWLAAVDAPVEAAFSLSTAVETPVLASTTCDSTVEMPTVVVDSDVLRLVKALRPDETCALVGDAPSATIVEIAVEKITPSEVVPERLVLSRIAPDRAVETTTPAEVVVESAVDVIADSEVWLDLAELDEVDRAVSSESALETWLACEVWADSSLETVVDSELLVPWKVETELAIVRPAPSTPFNTLVVG